MDGLSDQATNRKKRVLFMAEAVTLAHVARPHVLAQSLPTDHYEVLFACDPRYDSLFKDATYSRRTIETIPADRFLKLLENGTPIYDLSTLERYVENDLAVIDQFKPDAIVGDFRLSLSVSARLRGVPYIAISNAYWSPDAIIDCPVPELPITRWFGYRMGGLLFRLGKSTGFAIHAQAHNSLRRRLRLPILANDIRHIYVDADASLFADIPELVPLRKQTKGHYFVGPIPWSPAVEKPDWWENVKSFRRPIIYLTLGSSGDTRSLPVLLEGLSAIGGTVLAATAGRTHLGQKPSNVYAASYLPGIEAAQVADLVVCNGGSPTTYQAIAAGKPVLGIPSNLDQCLNMGAMKAAGVGEILRIRALNSQKIQQAARSLIARPANGQLNILAGSIRRTNAVHCLMQALNDF